MKFLSRMVWVAALWGAPLAASAQRDVWPDFDGDGMHDAVVYDADSATWHIVATALGEGSYTFDASGMRPVPGDYDGDGTSDFAIYDRTNGEWRVLTSHDWALHVLTLGADHERPVPGDYDGDGATDPATYDRETGVWRIRPNSSGVTLTNTFGSSAEWPAPGDYDGDGLTDLATYSRATGVWRVFLSSTWREATVTFGTDATRPVPGDYDGDGATDVAVYQTEAGIWHVLLSSRWEWVSVTFGTAATRPVPADYDGDGATDLAVYYRAAGEWYILPSTTWTLVKVTLGSDAMSALHSFGNGGAEGLILLAFGDSITYGGGSSADGPETGYPILLERQLEPAYGGQVYAVNVGHSGESTSEALDRFEAELDAADPDVLLLMEGTNDHFYGDDFDMIEDNLRWMVATALARGIEVVLATIPPVISNQYRDRSDQAARIAAFNPRIYDIAADYGVPVAPVYESITSVPGWEAALMEQTSANHPNDAGYQYVRQAFFDALSDGLVSGQYY